MIEILEQLRKELEASANIAIRDSGMRFFKESVSLYGVKASIVNKIAKEYYKQLQKEEKQYILDLCEELWKSGYMEESFVACYWAYSLRKQYTKQDFAIFEHWVNDYVSNWASCDTLCNHTIGEFIEQYPNYITELKKWTKSKNRWTRRASAVSLIVPARKGLFLDDIFEIADILFLDEDDLVKKGYGWMLKVASQKYETEVFEYVMRNKKNMPRTALRYAIEKMSKDLKSKAMQK